MLVSIFTIVYVLGGTQPDVSIVTGDPMTHEQCNQMVAASADDAPVTVDPVTGRPVIMTFYKCVPQDPKEQVKLFQDAIDTGMAG